MKIGTVVQPIKSFFLSNFKGRNVVITDGIGYDVNRWNGLRWYSIHTKFNDDQFKHISNIMIIIRNDVRCCNVGIADRKYLRIVSLR